MKDYELLGRRGQLLAELFLQDLKPQHLLEVTTPRAAYDYFVGFKTKSGATVTIAVEVKATQHPVRDHFMLITTRSHLDTLTRSNLPVLIIAVDVKKNQLFFSWASDIDPHKSSELRNHCRINLPVKEANDATKAELLARIEAIGSEIASRDRANPA